MDEGIMGPANGCAVVSMRVLDETILWLVEYPCHSVGSAGHRSLIYIRPLYPDRVGPQPEL